MKNDIHFKTKCIKPVLTRTCSQVIYISLLYVNKRQITRKAERKGLENKLIFGDYNEVRTASAFYFDRFLQCRIDLTVSSGTAGFSRIL